MNFFQMSLILIKNFAILKYLFASIMGSITGAAFTIIINQGQCRGSRMFLYYHTDYRTLQKQYIQTTQLYINTTGIDTLFYI